MKKFIVLIMALITIFSASVTTFASSGSTGYYADWAIVDTILNLQQGSQNCTLVKYNTARPTPSMVDGTGAIKTQKTTYNVLHALYETVTVEGASWSQNIWSSGVFDWYKYGDYCWIRYRPDTNSGIGWVANYQGKILYCDAPVEETTYDVVAIAGAPTYFLTDRPINTITSGYLGDLKVSYASWSNILSTLNNLSGSTSYYAYVGSVNGEYRYYILTLIGGNKYLVCNSAGQLFYSIKDEVPDDDDTGGGSTFDPTEVITAINSVYSAINDVGSNISTRLSNLRSSVENIGGQFDLHMNNTVSGFESIGNQLSTLNSYFTDLSGLFPVQETITLLGSDTRVAWDSADRITNVTASGFNGDLIVKERAGDLVDESGYEKVTINETEYSLYNDNNGYRRIKAANEYSGDGNPIPDGAVYYFSFDDTLSSSVGDSTFSYSGTPSYSTGIDGNAFVFSNNDYLSMASSGSIALQGSAFSLSFWLYLTDMTSVEIPYTIDFYNGSNISVYISEYSVEYVFSHPDSSTIHVSASNVLSINSWHNFSIAYSNSQVYCFVDGQLFAQESMPIPSYVPISVMIGEAYSRFPDGTMIDELILVNGQALWTSNFDPRVKAIFSEVVKDYFLPCTDQDITLNFYDSSGEQVTEYRWNQYTINTSRLPDGYTELESISSTGTQYIDSLYKPNQNTRVVIDYENSGNYGSTLYPLFGSRNATNDSSFSVWFGTAIYPQYGSVAYNANGSISVDIDSRFIYDFNKNVFSVGSNLITCATSTFSSDYNLCLLGSNTAGVIDNRHPSGILYSCQIYDNGTLVRDFVPCKNPSNAVGLYDLVNGQFYSNSGTGSFTAGNEVSNGSGIGQLVGVVSSTNANAYPNDGIQGDFYYEYIGAFTEYPSFSQTLSPTDVNGNAITMGRLEDDFSEIYMDISTMQWYCHDPQTQTEILLSFANQQIMNDTIYVRQNYTMLPADQITADALQNLLPVDSPVYLDMPEGAKLTITYDHYTGWFRMMYILMDKQTKLLSDLDIVNETIINVENTVIDITNNNPAYNVFYITKTDGTTESVGDAAKDAAVFVGDILSMFYRLVFDDALDNAGVIQDFEDVLTTTNTGVNVW